MILGIDPGWASFGIASQKEGKSLGKNSYEPRSFGSITRFIWALEKEKTWSIHDVSQVFLERFVVYAGVHSSASEDINLLIGALIYYFEHQGVPVTLVRAIEWKPAICKHLVRNHNFDNPYPRFDKKFSILAAQTLTGDTTIKSDHEADAICLSYLDKVKLK